MAVVYGPPRVFDLISVDHVIAGGNSVRNVGGLCVAKHGVRCDNASGSAVAIGVGEATCIGLCIIKGVAGHDSMWSSAGSEGMSVSTAEVMPKSMLSLVVCCISWVLHVLAVVVVWVAVYATV